MNSEIIKHIWSFIFFTLVQIMFFLNFNLYEYGFAFIYIGFILFLPLNTPSILLLLFAFSQGVLIDFFYNSIGINAFALVLIAFIKPTISKLFIPKMMDDINDLKSLENLGIQRMVIVVLLLSFVHHLVLFSFINGAEFIFSNIVKTFFSALITTLILIPFKKILFKNI